jgi:hypothetical protein
VMAGAMGGEVVATPLVEVVASRKALDLKLMELAGVLAK